MAASAAPPPFDFDYASRSIRSPPRGLVPRRPAPPRERHMPPPEVSLPTPHHLAPRAKLPKKKTTSPSPIRRQGLAIAAVSRCPTWGRGLPNFRDPRLGGPAVAQHRPPGTPAGRALTCPDADCAGDVAAASSADGKTAYLRLGADDFYLFFFPPNGGGPSTEMTFQGSAMTDVDRPGAKSTDHGAFTSFLAGSTPPACGYRGPCRHAQRLTRTPHHLTNRAPLWANKH